MIRYLASIATKSNCKPHAILHSRYNPLILSPIFLFSHHENQHKIKNILSQVMLTINNQMKSLIQTDILTSYSFQQNNQKVIINLSTNKDFIKIKNILINKFQIKGFPNVEVTLTPKKDNKIFERKANLAKVKKIIGVSSCRGGVGNSTIVVNIAYILQKQGYKVGIFDADIYAPSLPTLIGHKTYKLEHSKQNTNKTNPIIANGVKCMSFGFVQNQPATKGGAMASSIIAKLLLQTSWGQLDYLIVDMPPDTGDINLTVWQELKFDGAILVTSPQKLSDIYVLKGIQLFQDLKVRILALIQSKSILQHQKQKTEGQIFGEGYNNAIIDQLGIQNAFKIPLSSQITQIGIPNVISSSTNKSVQQTYETICKSIEKEISKPKNKSGAFYSTEQRFIIVQEDNKQKKINSVQLRSKCKCLECVNQTAQHKSLQMNQIDPEVYPVKIEPKGNYAIGVAWSDGHKTSIYSFKRLFSDQITGK